MTKNYDPRVIGMNMDRSRGTIHNDGNIAFINIRRRVGAMGAFRFVDEGHSDRILRMATNRYFVAMMNASRSAIC